MRCPLPAAPTNPPPAITTALEKDTPRCTTGPCTSFWGSSTVVYPTTSSGVTTSRTEAWHGEAGACIVAPAAPYSAQGGSAVSSTPL